MVLKIPPEFVIQTKFKLIFFAHKIEVIETETESANAKALRERFSIQVTQRKAHK